MRLLYLTTLTLLLFSCKRPYPKSDIEILLVDSNLVDSIKSNYDSFYVEIWEQSNWTVNHYLLYQDRTDNMLIYDSNRNIAAISISQNGIKKYVAEFYPNGQQKGPIFKKPPYSYDSLLLKYYHYNGRIRDIGYITKGFIKIGEWKHFDSLGNLFLIQKFDLKGQLIDKEHIKQLPQSQ